MEGTGFAAFLLASLVLAVAPGPAVVYIVARTLVHGRRIGFASVAGVALGNLCNALAASLGLAVLFTLWSGAFLAVKLAGAAYLIWLGISSLRTQAPASVGEPTLPPTPPAVGRVLRDGFIVALLNPKTALFFAAFLPQFIDPAASALRQAVLLGSCFVALAACTDAVYVLAAGAAARALRGRPAVDALARRASAAVFIGLGVAAALSDGPPAR